MAIGTLKGHACPIVHLPDHPLSRKAAVDILYLLIPLSAVLVLGIVGVFGWAVHAGQFDDLEHEAGRALVDESSALDEGQGAAPESPQQSRAPAVERIAAGGRG